jgi:hypothetical protein
MRYVAVCETEGLICDSDSERHLVSNDSDISALDDLSKDTDNSFLVDAEIKHFCAALSSQV